MTNSVFIKADENGSVIRVSDKNPDYGWVIFAQETPTFSNNWLKLSTRSVRQMGIVADLERLNYSPNQKLAGQIIVTESFNPFNENEPERDLKIAGSTGVICTVNGEPIYRQTEYTRDMNRVDVLIDHDNTEEIRMAIAQQQNNTKVKVVTNSVEELADAFNL